MSTPTDTQTENPSTPVAGPTAQTTPDTNAEGVTEGSGANGTQSNGDAKPKAERAKAPDVSTISADAINAASLAIPEMVAAAEPERKRPEQQVVMDAVATKAYAAWVKAGRPAAWGKMPVVTYFLDEADLPKWRYLIRRACDVVKPEGTATGVRVLFGNEFTLSEGMAKKIDKPEAVGKTVLAWAAIDKRAPNKATKPDTKPNAAKK